MRTITTPDELDALAQAHDHGEQVVILHCRRPDDPYGREWRLYHLEWERWDEPDGTVTYRPVWMAHDYSGTRLDEDWLHETTPAYVVEPQEPVGEQIARTLAEHQPTTGMSVASGVTCRCGYWTGNEHPGVTRPAGLSGLTWHQAQEIAARTHGGTP